MSEKIITLKSDGAYKFNKIYLNYSFKKKESDKLFVVFSGMTSTAPGVNTMSYYGLREQLGGNVLHIADSFGNHGCYLLSISGNTEIQEAVMSLINIAMVERNILKDNLFLVGTSKGATTAISFGLLLGFGNIICGDPQIKLGDELFNVPAPTWESVAYVMTGRINPVDRFVLNDMIEGLFKKHGKSFEGSMIVLAGKRYFDKHCRYLIEYTEKYNVKGIDVRELDISTHKEIIEPFYDEMSKYNKEMFTFEVIGNQVIINSGEILDNGDFSVYAFSDDSIDKLGYRMKPIFTFNKNLESVNYFNVYLKEIKGDTSVFKVEFRNGKYQVAYLRSIVAEDESNSADRFTFEVLNNQVVINSGEELENTEFSLYAFSDENVEKADYRMKPIFPLNKNIESINHFNVYLRENNSVISSYRVERRKIKYQITFLRKFIK